MPAFPSWPPTSLVLEVGELFSRFIESFRRAKNPSPEASASLVRVAHASPPGTYVRGQLINVI